MAVTVAQLAGALRINDGSANPPAPIDGIIARMLAVAEAHVGKRVGSDCPEDVQDEAAIRMAAYLFDQPNYGRGSSMHSAFRNSGAASLIAPWRQRRLGIQAEPAASLTPAQTPTPTPPAPAPTRTYRLAWADTQQATEAEMQAGTSGEFPDGQDTLTLTMPQRSTTGYAILWLAPITLSLQQWYLSGNPQTLGSVGSPYPLTVNGVDGRAWATNSLLSPLLSGRAIRVDVT